MKAKGLMSWMLSLPDDWNYTIEGTAKCMKEGKDAVRGAYKELEEAGYLVRKSKHDSEGKFSSMEYILYEQSLIKGEFLPIAENPTTEKPTTEKPTQINTNITNNENTKSSLRSKEEQAPLQKKKTSNEKSRQRITKIFSNPDNIYIIEALREWLEYCDNTNKGYRATNVEKWATFLRDNAGSNVAKAKAIVQKSIARDYKDLYPVKAHEVSPKGYKDPYKIIDEQKRKRFNPDHDDRARDESGKLITY